MNIEHVVKKVSEFYSVDTKDVYSQRKGKYIVLARQITYYIVRTKFGASFPTIGRNLNRDHSTILYGYRKIAELINNNNKFATEVGTIIEQLSIPKDKSTDYFTPEIKGDYALDKPATLRLPIFLPQQLKSSLSMVEEYKKGITLEEIGKKHNLTRERIRQIIMRRLTYDAFNSIIIKDEKNVIDYVDTEKKNHRIKSNEIKNVHKEQPIIKVRGWSMHGDYCRKCATRTKKHKSYGFCVDCYPKSEIFKNLQKESRLRNLGKRKSHQKLYLRKYLQRPEVLRRLKLKSDLKFYGGNREKSIEHNNFRCTECGIKRDTSIQKGGKDFHVMRRDNNSENNSLNNLKPVCSNCFYKILRGRTVRSKNANGLRSKLSMSQSRS